MNTAHVFNFKMRQPRRNLPAKAARKRGEANFVSAFSKAYIESVAPNGIGGREFPLAGFGIADFVWVAWCPNGRDGSALSLERLEAVLAKHRFTAFEMKLTHWRKGLTQAYRYSYFADRSILVVPPTVAVLARKELPMFKELGVGLWAFDIESGKTTRHFTPRVTAPKNKGVRSRAVALLSRKVYFGERSKLRQARL
jgi:hypothetical protein